MSQPPTRRKTKTLAELIPGCMSDALAAQGFANADIISNWPAIVGPQLAGYCQPIKLQWPPRGPASNPGAPRPQAVLLVRVESAFVLELQHSAAIVIERVNRYFGWACVGQLRFRQGPIERAKPPKAPLQADAATKAHVAAMVGDVADERLGDALRRLGEAVTMRESAKITRK
ncbi:hypothetical protein GCM10007276_10340 [Agaricicola taiwanensis]|uniref:DUF721 domain-containing protein n=1 Tax=Agaricicola taiwanensis TaxID=591372 RepID=A0A8J2YBW4_9RHOB|nr:DciA family protein [Agaricicola taiwanensis]GGE34791.1 hypothetical protein GCM10007276_10340 [Agaricicola taiwanensis]